MIDFSMIKVKMEDADFGDVSTVAAATLTQVLLCISRFKARELEDCSKIVVGNIPLCEYPFQTFNHPNFRHVTQRKQMPKPVWSMAGFKHLDAQFQAIVRVLLLIQRQQSINFKISKDVLINKLLPYVFANHLTMLAKRTTRLAKLFKQAMSCKETTAEWLADNCFYFGKAQYQYAGIVCRTICGWLNALPPIEQCLRVRSNLLVYIINVNHVKVTPSLKQAIRHRFNEGLKAGKQRLIIHEPLLTGADEIIKFFKETAIKPSHLFTGRYVLDLDWRLSEQTIDAIKRP